MYQCENDKTINDDVLSMFTIIKTQPTMLTVQDVVEETGMDEQRFMHVKTHIAQCVSCAKVLEEYQKMQLVLEQVKAGRLEQFQSSEKGVPA